MAISLLLTDRPVVTEPTLERRQTRFVAAGTVDFTTAEPAHSEGVVYRNTATGNGQTTTGQTFSDKNFYRSDNGVWTEIVPDEGFQYFDQATKKEHQFDAGVWGDATTADAVAKSDIATAAEVDAGTAADKVVNTAELNRKLSEFTETGQLAGTEATYATLPAVPADASATVKYHAWLTSDDVGTGTAQAPQYPKGVYVPDGTFTSWVLAVASSADVYENALADFVATAANYNRAGIVAPATIQDVITDRMEPMELPADGGTLEFGKRYFGAGVKTLNVPAVPATGPKWMRIVNTEQADGGGDLTLAFTGDVRMPTSGVVLTNPVVALTPRTAWDLFTAADGVLELEISIPTYLSWDTADSGKRLLRGAGHSIVNSSNGELEFFVPTVPVGVIEIDFSDLSVRGIKLSQLAEADGGPAAATHIINRDGSINNSTTIGADLKGAYIRLTGNTDLGYWDVKIFQKILPEDQTRFLDYIEVGLYSDGTSAGSAVGLTFYDVDGNAYPASSWAYDLNVTQWSGGSTTLTTDKAVFGGTIALGHNKDGYARFFYVGDTPNGLSDIIPNHISNGVSQEVTVVYEGTNYTDAFASVGLVTGPLYWTTKGAIEATDQGAPFLAATQYAEKAIFSRPESDPADPDFGKVFNWTVNDGQSITDTEVPNNTDAEFTAIKPKLTRFGIGTTEAPYDNAQPYVAGMNIPAGGYVVYSGTDADVGLWQATSAVTNADADIRNEPLLFRGELPVLDRSGVVADGANIGLDGFSMSTNETSQRFILRAGHTATFQKNSDPAIVEMLGDSSLWTLTDVAGTSREAVITAPADSDVEIEYQRNSTQFNIIVSRLAGGVSKPWVYSTDGMNAADGDKIIVQPNHAINFPGVTDLQSVSLAPSTGNWSDIANGTGSFNPDAAWTFGNGQNLLFGSDVITAIANLADTNWLLLSGGEDAPSQEERIETVADLPLATTVSPGAVRVVYNDPTAANNRAWVAFGPPGGSATGWQ